MLSQIFTDLPSCTLCVCHIEDLGRTTQVRPRGETSTVGIVVFGGFWRNLGAIFDFFLSSLLLRSVAVVNETEMCPCHSLSACLPWCCLFRLWFLFCFWFLTPTSCRCLSFLRAGVRGVWFSPQFCQCLSPRCCLVLGGQG